MALLRPRAQILSGLVNSGRSDRLGLRFHAAKSLGPTCPTKNTESTMPTPDQPCKFADRKTSVETAVPKMYVESTGSCGNVLCTAPTRNVRSKGALKSLKKEALTELKAVFEEWRAKAVFGAPGRNCCLLDRENSQYLITIAASSSAADLRAKLSNFQEENVKCVWKSEYSSCELEGFIEHYDTHLAICVNKSHPGSMCFECVKLHSKHTIIVARASITIAARFLGACKD